MCNVDGYALDTLIIPTETLADNFTTGENNSVFIDDSLNIIFSGQMKFVDGTSPNAIIFKINRNGDTLWTKEFKDSINFSALASCKLTKDKNYIFCGFKDFDLISQAWLIKMDPDGNILWENTYGGFDGEFAYSVDTTADGGYIMAGFTTSHPGRDRDIYVVKTDSEGNLEWEKSFGGEGHELGRVLALENGHALVYGNYKFIDPDWDLSRASHGYAMEIDENGNKIWDNYYTNIDTNSTLFYVLDEVFNDVVLVEDGYVFCGASTDTAVGDPIGWAMKTDFSGNVLWNRLFKIRENDHYLWDMEVLPGGDLLFGGFVFGDSDTNSQDGWVIRTNCLGFEGPPIKSVAISTDSINNSVTLTNASQRFGDGEINWGDGSNTTFTEHDDTVFTHTYTSNGTKEITFTINACYHHKSETFTTQITNIPAPLANFKLYPNPNNGQIPISYNPGGETLSANILIHDLAGRLIFNATIPEYFRDVTLNLEDLSTGVYLLQFKADNGFEVVEKIVVL